MNPTAPAGFSMSPQRAVYLIARREFQTRIRGKVFVVGTIIAVAMVGVYALLQLLVIDHLNTTTTYHVGFSGPAQSLAEPLVRAAPSLGFTVRVSHVSDLSQGTGAVRAGTLDALVAGPLTSPEVTVETQLDAQLEVALNSVVRQTALASELSSAGLDPGAVEAQANRASIHLDTLKPFNAASLQQPIIGFVMAFLLYVFLSIYGALISQGVVAEKASRVVEILLSTVRSEQLLLGKVLGIGLVGLLQMGIIGACALALVLPTGVLTVPAAAVGAVLAGVMWFVLGFVLYSLMLAATASLVSRVEEVQTATMPVTLLLVLAWLLAYVVAIPAISAATGSPVPSGLTTLNTVFSLVPPFTPVLMSIRMAAGGVPLWQVLTAVALMLTSIAGVAWLAARMYDNSVLRFGARIKLSTALRRAS